MKPKKLLLFDIDGTLTEGHGHQEAFAHAFRKIYGVDAEQDVQGSHGMTDKQIVVDSLIIHGLTEDEIVPRREDAMKEMARFYKEFIKQADKEIFPGVSELIKELDSRGFILGLVTGNVEDIAWMKLDKVGIGRFFRFGGFGSEDSVRSNLVRLAIERAERDHGFDAEGDVFVIGDTPPDIRAGEEAGVKTIGVCTGIFSREDLEKEGADFVLNNLTDTKKFLEIVGD